MKPLTHLRPGSLTLPQLAMTWLSLSAFVGVPLMFLDVWVPELGGDGFPLHVELGLAVVVLPLGWGLGRWTLSRRRATTAGAPTGNPVLDQLWVVHGASPEGVHGLGAELSRGQRGATLWLPDAPKDLEAMHAALARLDALSAAIRRAPAP